MTEKDELKILRSLLITIGNCAIGYNNEKISKIISEIRYGYCYNQTNSNSNQTNEEIEKMRIDSLNRLNNFK